MPDEKRKTFADLLKTFSLGAVNDEITEAFDQLLEDMLKSAKTAGGKPKGRMTLVFDLKLDNSVYDVTHNVAVKRPPPARGRAFLFATEDGRISDRSPQLEIPEVSATTTRGLDSPADAPRALAEPERSMRVMT